MSSPDIPEDQAGQNASLAWLAEKGLHYGGPELASWVPPRPGTDWDVAIIGGGQSGQAIAFGLRRAGIARITILEAESRERTGLWRTRARMDVLRTPKELPGPELEIGSVSFRAWFEATRGEDAYTALEKIPRLVWAEYLDWFQEVTKPPLRYGARVTKVQGAGDALDLHITEGGATRVERTRKLVLASGIAGAGAPSIPEVLTSLPKTLYAHSHERIDFARLDGLSVAVLGAGSSAFDAAIEALRAGAREAHMFSRRADLSRHFPSGLRKVPAAVQSFNQLPDADRWFVAKRLRSVGAPPPIESVVKAAAFPNFKLHFNAPWKRAEERNGRVAAQIGDLWREFDFVVAGTGYVADVGAREELRDIAPLVARWGDRYQPPEAEADAVLARYPYLGPGYQLLEREPGSAPFVPNIHVYNVAAQLSFGLPVGDIPSLRRGVPRLVEAIGRELFFADYALHRETIHGAPTPAFEREPYLSAIAEE